MPVVGCCDIYIPKFVLKQFRCMFVSVYMYFYVPVLQSEGSPPKWSTF